MGKCARWISAAAFAATLNGICGLALAQDADRFGYYAAGTGGVSSPINDGDLETDDSAGTGERFDFELDNGLVASGAAGVYSGPVRGEFEIGYHSNDVDTLEGAFAPGLADADGDMTAISFMLNGFYDFHIADPLTLYVGGGVGVASLDFEASTFAADGTRFRTEADDAAVCWQVMAGLDLEVIDRVHATIGYRLWAPLGGEVDVTSTTGGTNASVRSSGDDLDLPLIHSIEVGLRIDL